MANASFLPTYQDHLLEIDLESHSHLGEAHNVSYVVVINSLHMDFKTMTNEMRELRVAKSKVKMEKELAQKKLRENESDLQIFEGRSPSSN